MKKQTILVLSSLVVAATSSLVSFLFLSTTAALWITLISLYSFAIIAAVCAQHLKKQETSARSLSTTHTALPVVGNEVAKSLPAAKVEVLDEKTGLKISPAEEFFKMSQFLSSDKRGITPYARLDAAAAVGFFHASAQGHQNATQEIAKDPRKQYYIACYLLSEKDAKGAEMWFGKSAEKEYAPAMYQLGLLLKERDPDKSLEWMIKAGEKDHRYAIPRLVAYYKEASEKALDESSKAKLTAEKDKWSEKSKACRSSINVSSDNPFSALPSQGNT